MHDQNKEHTVWTISPSTQIKTQQLVLNEFQRTVHTENDAPLHAQTFEQRQNTIPFLHTGDHTGEVIEQGIGERAFVAEMNALKRI